MIVVWRVTEHCNLSCPFCGYDRSLARPRRDADPQQIHAWGAALAAHQAATGKPVLVSWLGGEPLLWPPLGELTEYYRGHYGLRVSTTTNGTPLQSSALRRHLLEHYAELTVSIDALGPRHDQLRGCPGLFEKLRRNIALLVAAKAAQGRGPKLRVNLILMRSTFDELEPLAHELATWGFEEICFNQLGGNDRPEFYPENRLTPEQADRLVAVVPALRAALAERGVGLLGSSAYLRRLSATARNERLAIADCHPGETFLFIDERGRASPCSFTSETHGIPLAALAPGDALTDLSRVFTRALQGRRVSACDDCQSTHVFSKFEPSPVNGR